MDVAPIIFLGGAVILLWIAQWLRMNKPQPPLESDEVEQVLREIPITSEGDAILVSREHGQVIYANGPARHLLAINGGEPHLEVIASHAQPSENFLGLFAEETQASFQLGNRWVEASSHRIPAGPELRTVVIMRELSADGQASGGSLDLSRAFRLINLIGDTVDTTLGIEQTLQSLLGLLRAELRYDSGEINIRDDITGNFVPRGWVGDASYLVELSLAGGVYRPDEGFTGWIARHRQPLLLTTRSELDTIQPKISKNPYRSFLGVPLVLGDTLMGTIEFGSLQEHHFSQGELSLMQALSKPIAVAIYNASLYADQVRRIEDITTLQQAIEQHAEVEQSEKVFAVLNERIAKLSNAEMSGIFLYDEARRGLVPALPFYGLPEAIVRSLFIPMPIDSPQRDIWETQSYWISNDVADEPLVEALGLSPIVNVAGIRSTAWLPLQVSAKTRIGVMAVSNKRGEGFTPRDIQNLRALASQATVVVENIQLYGREKSMDAQLAGLQEITYAIGALTEEGEFFSELTQRIAKLMNVQTCGFMLYEEGAKRLMSRLPFYGIEDDAIRDYQITLKSGTIFDELWTEEDSWFSNRVQNDPLTFEAGLDQLAVQLGVQKTLFAVLSTGGRRIGVVQVSNKLNGQDFNDADARLLLIFATQAATIMENARLFQEVQRNSEQAQRLRSIAEKAGKISTNEDALADLLQEIANFTQSSVVFINVLSQPGSLVTYPRWVYGTELTEPIVQDTSAQGFEHSVVRSRRPFISNDIANEQLILASYRQLSQRFDLHRVLVVPLFVGDRSLGEMGVANREGGYTESDLSNLGAIAAQVAAAFDRLLQYQATGQNLTRRMEELDAISRVSNELTLTLDFDQILNLIRSETIKATGATGCTVALLYPNTRWERPDAPELERRLGAVRTMDRLADLEIEAIHRGASSVIVPDYSESEYKPLPRDARSGLAASILYVDQTVGVLHVYHTEANRFDEYAATFITTMATKASLGYGNAIRFQEQMERSERLRRRVEQLNRIFELSHMLPSNTEPILVLEAVAFSIQQAVGFDSVVMLLSDETEGVMKRVAQSGLPLEVFEKSKANTVPLKALNLILKDKYRISESYFFPIHEVTQWYSESVVALSTAFAGNRTIAYSGMDQWHDGDMLLVTITGSTGKLLGLISLDRRMTTYDRIVPRSKCWKFSRIKRLPP
jgi:GAF domain-containing protein